jgi:hypothetical protein
MTFIALVTPPDDDGFHPEHAQADELSCREYLRFRLNAQRSGWPVLRVDLAWERHRASERHQSCRLQSGLQAVADAAGPATEALREAAKAFANLHPVHVADAALTPAK